MSATKVFLDSGIFIALLNRRDRWHQQAAALFTGARPRWMTSALVRSETYSWFLHKHGEEAARAFRMMFDSLEGLVAHDTTRAHHDDTCKVLERLRGSRLTYVDASSLALIAKYKVKTVWSTDHHLSLTGAEVMPRS
jgi:predicted nucleic acid-binding protein